MAGAHHRLRELREARNLSLQQMADLVGTTKSSYHRIESGVTELDLPMMRRIGAKLGVKPSELLLDRDVEYRAGDTEDIIRESLAQFAPDDREAFARLVVDLTRICRRMAGNRAAVTLAGNPMQAAQLAELWNDLDERERERALAFLRGAVELKPARAA
jgi:transcriptional regulator with XRE-family HTH domain